jgi:hypothetical protein
MGQQIPQNFQGDIAPISPRGIVCLNNSPDWLTVYYRKRVSLAAWDAMPDGLEVESCGMAWRLHLAKASSISRVVSDAGIWIKALDPRAEWSDAAELSGLPEQYPCEVQLQGHAWSHGIDYVDLLECIEAALGLEDVPRVCGRLDLASDLWMSAAQYAHLICGASMDGVKENWVSRARGESTRIQFETGPKKLVRGESNEPFSAAIVGQEYTTLYLGARSGMQLVIYRKDCEFEGNTGFILKDRWKQAGWVPWDDRLVVRVEFRFAREWIREHKFGDVKGKDVNPDVVLRGAGGLWLMATTKFRLAPQTPKGRKQKRDRPTSEVWKVVQKTWDDWDCALCLGPVEQVPDRNKLIETLGKRIEDARLAFSDSEFEQLMPELFRGLPGLEDYVKNRSRWRHYANGK